MSAEDPPLHCEDAREAAGSPAAVVDDGSQQDPPAFNLDSLNPTLNMNFFISYSGPPYIHWSYIHNLNYQWYAQQPFNGGPFCPFPPRPPVFTYYPPHHTVEKPMTSRPVWPAPARYALLPFKDKPAVKTTQGASKKIENEVPKSQPLFTKDKSVDVEDEVKVDSTLPPNIYDETVFPSLTTKETNIYSNFNVRPHSLKGTKKNEDMESSTRIGKSYCDDLLEQQNENNTIERNKLLKDIKNPLEMAAEGECVTTEIDESHTSVVLANENNPSQKKAHQTSNYQDGPQLMTFRHTRPLIYMEPPPPIDLCLRDPKLYHYLVKYCPKLRRMEELGYPVVSYKNPKEAVIFKKEFHQKTLTKNNTRRDKMKTTDKLCDRCGKSFFIKTGKCFQREKCFYHWGKTQLTDDFKVYLSCCKQHPTSWGCDTAKSHVWNGLSFGMNTNLKGFVRPAVSAPDHNEVPKIFGLDCEMCFTTEGLELVKVAMVDLEGNQVYYSLVFPEHDIVDYNTRFSGVSEKDFCKSKAKNFKKVQEDVLNLIEIDTIIIGHGLENDLRALKIIHQFVVDTSIVYPHEHGLPFRRPLKEIAAEVLGRVIQEGGHNPVEDANVCVDLILKKLEVDFNIRLVREAKKEEM